MVGRGGPCWDAGVVLSIVSEPVAGMMVTPSVRLEERIGEGGMGSVWRARDLGSGEETAVKFMASDLRADAVLRERFAREARVAQAIASPHVVRVVAEGATADGGVPFLVMELCRGESLREKLARLGRLELDEVARIVEEICGGLAVAHGAGVIHRDIKPDNVFLVAPAGRVKLLDFGIARREARGERALTQAGTVMGTLPYMSPEQLLFSERVDPGFDLWATAVLAYEALSGQQPFVGEEMADVMRAVVEQRYAPPSALDLPAALDAFFARAFAADPRARPATALDFARTFAGAVTAARVAMGPARRAPQPTLARRFSLALTPAPRRPGVAAVTGFAERPTAAAPSWAAPTALAARPSAPAGAALVTAPTAAGQASGMAALVTAPTAAGQASGMAALVTAPTAAALATAPTAAGMAAVPATAPTWAAPTAGAPAAAIAPTAATGQRGPHAAPSRRRWWLVVLGTALVVAVGIVGGVEALRHRSTPRKVRSDAPLPRAPAAAPGASSRDEPAAPPVPTQSEPSPARLEGPDPCAGTEDCDTYGWCASNDYGGCIATRDEHCRLPCSNLGHCKAVDGRCQATKASDCAAADQCALSGTCSLVGGECGIASDADCRKASACEQLGQCTFREENSLRDCVVASDADCAHTVECRDNGYCHARGGLCAQ